MAAAPPFVSYSSMSRGGRPGRRMAVRSTRRCRRYKAHVQEYPGCQRIEASSRVEDDGSMRLHCYTTWDTPEQLEVFLERGYTFERLLGRRRRCASSSARS